MNWSVPQRAMLSVMGYTLYRQAGDEAPPDLAVVPAALPTPGRTPGQPPGRLMQALLRAAGGALPAGCPLPPLDELRASAAAKRALWPALRALRRRG